METTTDWGIFGEYHSSSGMGSPGYLSKGENCMMVKRKVREFLFGEESILDIIFKVPPKKPDSRMYFLGGCGLITIFRGAYILFGRPPVGNLRCSWLLVHILLGLGMDLRWHRRDDRRRYWTLARRIGPSGGILSHGHLVDVGSSVFHKCCSSTQ